MKRDFTLGIRSDIAASPGEIWDRALTAKGVNYELWPLMRMTFPTELPTEREAPQLLGKRLFRSWVLLFGFLPIDYDDITIVEYEAGRRFLERSTMLSMRVWEHERVVTPTDEGSTVTDKLRFQARIPLSGYLLRFVVKGLFTWRHRRLRRRYRVSKG